MQYVIIKVVNEIDSRVLNDMKGQMHKLREKCIKNSMCVIVSRVAC